MASTVKPYKSNPLELKSCNPKFAEELLARCDTLISRIRPTSLSLQRRYAIIEHVTAIVRRCFPLQDVTAVPFGSVPLKTYLPDGDIDLSIYSSSPGAQALKETLRETWASQLQMCLEDEANNPNAVFKVANVQVIHAEVKLLKCLVDNIVVDISFFQIGGLNTYHFLEDVDRFVDQAIPVRKHLFKDSIILVKGWCYYESRVLGAHHGLISTYALETLVLYVINLYHRDLTNPLQVLYRFLVECSGFDWERFCLSLQGPIPLSSFPNPTVETPEALQRDALLTEEFMARAYRKYTSPQLAALGGEAKPFAIKQLNVMDPILPNNNLGRSVSKASYLRIRRAFEHGARMLADIAEQAKELGPWIGAKGFDNFFGKVWNAQRPRHVNGGVPMGGPAPHAPGLHHPVALRPMPQPFPHVAAPPPPSTSAPPIAGGGGGAGQGYGPGGGGAAGGRGREGHPQIVYGNIAGDLHMAGQRQDQMGQAANAPLQAQMQAQAQLHMHVQMQASGPRAGPGSGGAAAAAATAADAAQAAHAARYAGAQWLGQQPLQPQQLVHSAGAASGARAPGGEGAAPQDQEAMMRSNPAVGALFALSQLASGLQGAAGDAAVAAVAGGASSALAATVAQAVDSLAAAAATSGGGGTDPQSRQRLLAQASVLLMNSQSLPMVLQAGQGAAAAVGGSAEHLMPHMLGWGQQVLTQAGGHYVGGVDPLLLGQEAAGGPETSKMHRVRSAPVMPVVIGGQGVAAPGTGIVPAAPSAGRTAQGPTGDAEVEDVEAVAERSAAAAAELASGWDAPGCTSSAAADVAAPPGSAAPPPAAAATSAAVPPEEFGQGPSDASEDAAAACEGLVATPSTADLTAVASSAAAPAAGTERPAEGPVAAAPGAASAAAAPRQDAAASASTPAQPQQAARLLVTPPGAAEADADGGGVGSPRMQLPYAVALVLPEEVEQQLLNRSPGSATSATSGSGSQSAAGSAPSSASTSGRGAGGMPGGAPGPPSYGSQQQQYHQQQQQLYAGRDMSNVYTAGSAPSSVVLASHLAAHEAAQMAGLLSPLQAYGAGGAAPGVGAAVARQSPSAAASGRGARPAAAGATPAVVPPLAGGLSFFSSGVGAPGLLQASPWQQTNTGLAAMSPEQLSSLAQMLQTAGYARQMQTGPMLASSLPGALLHTHPHAHVLQGIPAAATAYMPFGMPPPPPPPPATVLSASQQQQQIDNALLAAAAAGYAHVHAHSHPHAHAAGAALQLAAAAQQQQHQSHLGLVQPSAYIQHLQAQHEAVAAAAAQHQQQQQQQQQQQRRFSHDGSSAVGSTSSGTLAGARQRVAHTVLAQSAGGAPVAAAAGSGVGDLGFVASGTRSSSRGGANAGVRRTAVGPGAEPATSAAAAAIGTVQRLSAAAVHSFAPAHGLGHEAQLGHGGTGRHTDPTTAMLTAAAAELLNLQQRGALPSSAPTGLGSHGASGARSRDGDDDSSTGGDVAEVAAGSAPPPPPPRSGGDPAGPVTAMATPAPSAESSRRAAVRVGTKDLGVASQDGASTSGVGDEAVAAGLPASRAAAGSGSTASGSVTQHTGLAGVDALAADSCSHFAAVADAAVAAVAAVAGAQAAAAAAGSSSTGVGRAETGAAQGLLVAEPPHNPTGHSSGVGGASAGPGAGAAASAAASVPIGQPPQAPALNIQLQKLYAHLQATMPLPPVLAQAAALMARSGAGGQSGAAAGSHDGGGPQGASGRQAPVAPGTGAAPGAAAAAPAAAASSASSGAGASGDSVARHAGSQSGYQSAPATGAPQLGQHAARLPGGHAGGTGTAQAPGSSSSTAAAAAGMATGSAPQAVHPAAAIPYGRMGGLSHDLMMGVSPPSPHLPPNLPPPPPPALAHNIQHSPPSWLYAQVQRHGIASLPYMFDLKGISGGGGAGSGDGMWGQSLSSSLAQSPAQSLGSSAGHYMGGAARAPGRAHAGTAPSAAADGASTSPAGGAAQSAGSQLGASARDTGASHLSVPPPPLRSHHPHPQLTTSHARDPHTVNLEYTRAIIESMGPLHDAAATAAGSMGGGAAGGSALSAQASGTLAYDDQLLFEVEGSAGGAGSTTSSTTSQPRLSHSGLAAAAGAGGGGGVAAGLPATRGSPIEGIAAAAAGGQADTVSAGWTLTLHPPLGPTAGESVTVPAELRFSQPPSSAGGRALASAPVSARTSGPGTGAGGPGPGALPPRQTPQQVALPAERPGAPGAGAASGAAGSVATATPGAEVAQPAGSQPRAGGVQQVGSSGSIGSAGAAPEVLQHLTPAALTPTSLSSSGSTPLSHSPPQIVVAAPATALGAGPSIEGASAADASSGGARTSSGGQVATGRPSVGASSAQVLKTTASGGGSATGAATVPSAPEQVVLQPLPPLGLPPILQFQRLGEQAAGLPAGGLPWATAVPPNAATTNATASAVAAPTAPPGLQPPLAPYGAPPLVRMPSQRYDPLAAAAAAKRASSSGSAGGSLNPSGSSLPFGTPQAAPAATWGAAAPQAQTSDGGAPVAVVAAPPPQQVPSPAVSSPVVGLTAGGCIAPPVSLSPPSPPAAQALLAAAIGAQPREGSRLLPPGSAVAAASGQHPAMAAAAAAGYVRPVAAMPPTFAAHRGTGGGDGAHGPDGPPTPSASAPLAVPYSQPQSTQPAEAEVMAASATASGRPSSDGLLLIDAGSNSPPPGLHIPHSALRGGAPRSGEPPPMSVAPVDLASGDVGASSAASAAGAVAARLFAGAGAAPRPYQPPQVSLEAQQAAPAQGQAGSQGEAKSRPYVDAQGGTGFSSDPAHTTAEQERAPKKPGPYRPPHHPLHQPHQLVGHLHAPPPPPPLVPAASQPAAAGHGPQPAPLHAATSGPSGGGGGGASGPSGSGAGVTAAVQGQWTTAAIAAAAAAAAAATAAPALASGGAARGGTSAAAREIPQHTMSADIQQAVEAVRRATSRERMHAPQPKIGGSAAPVAAATAGAATPAQPSAAAFNATADSAASRASATPDPLSLQPLAPLRTQAAADSGAAPAPARGSPRSGGDTTPTRRGPSSSGAVSSYLAAATNSMSPGSPTAGASVAGSDTGEAASPSASPSAKGRARTSLDFGLRGGGAEGPQYPRHAPDAQEGTGQLQPGGGGGGGGGGRSGARPGSSHGQGEGGGGGGKDRSRLHSMLHGQHHAHHHHQSHNHNHSTSQGSHGHGRHAASHVQGLLGGGGPREDGLGQAHAQGQGSHGGAHSGRGTPHGRHGRHGQQQQQEPAEPHGGQDASEQEQEWQRVSRRGGSAGAHRGHHHPHISHGHHHHFHHRDGSQHQHQHQHSHTQHAGGHHAADQEGRWQSKASGGAAAGGKGYAQQQQQQQQSGPKNGAGSGQTGSAAQGGSQRSGLSQAALRQQQARSVLMGGEEQSDGYDSPADVAAQRAKEARGDAAKGDGSEHGSGSGRGGRSGGGRRGG